MKKHVLSLFITLLTFQQIASGQHSLSVSTPASNLSILPLLAEKKGFFEELGLDISISKTQSGKMSMDAVIGRTADVGFVVDSNLAFLHYQKNDLKVFASIGTRLDNHILYRENTGIIQPEDLKTRKIAYTPAVSSHIFLYRFLKSSNISWNEIQATVIQIPAMNSAMKGELIDAVSIWEPWGSNIERDLGNKIKKFSAPPSLYPARAFVATTDDILTKKKRELELFLHGLEKARIYFSRNKTEVYKLLAKDLGVSNEMMPIVSQYHHYNIDVTDAPIRLVESIGAWIKETQGDFKNEPLPNYRTMFIDEIFKSYEKNFKKEIYKINICRPNNMIASLLYIAEAKDLLSRENIDAHFEVATNAKICSDMLLAGKADLMLGAEGPFTTLATTNPDISILAKVQTNPETAIFARKDKGINDFKDLKDKKIGYLPGTVSYFFLNRILKKHNIRKDEVKLIPLQPPAMSQSIASGLVDAISTWEPWGSKGLSGMQNQADSVILSDTELYTQKSLLQVTNESLKKYPDLGIRIIKVFEEAIQFINENPEESIKLLSKNIIFDEDVLRRLWPKYEHKVMLSDLFVKQMEDNFTFLKADDENFKSVEMPNYRKFINSDALNSTIPENVDINY